MLNESKLLSLSGLVMGSTNQNTDVNSLLKRMASLIDQTFEQERNERLNLTNTLSALLSMLVIRIESLEDNMLRTTGQMDVNVGTDLEIVRNSILNSMSGESASNRRLKNNDFNSAFSGSVLNNTPGTRNQNEKEIHNSVKGIRNTENIADTILANFTDNEKDAEFLYGVYHPREKTNVVNEFFQGMRGGVVMSKKWVKYLPVVGSVLSQLVSIVEGTLSVIDRLVNPVDETRLHEVADASMGSIGIDAKLLNDICLSNPGLSRDIVFDYLMLGVMEGANIVRGMDLNTIINKGTSPTIHYYLAPITQVLFGEIIGEITAEVLKSFGLLKLANWTNKIPMHGFLIFTFFIDTTHRRVINMQTGDISAPQIKQALLGELLFGNLMSYDDNLQTLVNGIWVDDHPARYGKLADVDLTKATLVDTHINKLSYNYTLEFLRNQIEFDTTYHILTHNCQDQAREIIEFCLYGNFPHWWNSLLSARLIEAELENKYGSCCGFNVPHPYATSQVCLNQKTTGDNLNMLEVIRQSVADKKVGFLSEITELGR